MDINSHIQNLYHYVGIIAQNHNKIVGHLNDLHKNVSALHENVRAIKNTLLSRSPSPKQTESPGSNSLQLVKK